jgi:hypothetical protein
VAYPFAKALIAYSKFALVACHELLSILIVAEFAQIFMMFVL